MDALGIVAREHLVADLVRLVLLMVGFTLAMSCVKFGYLALRHGEGYRGWGLASYALLVITPAIMTLHRFGEPLYVWAMVTYALAMVCGVISLRAAYTIDVYWTARLGSSRKSPKGPDDAP